MASEAALHIADNWAAGDPLLADEVDAAIQAAVQAEREAIAELVAAIDRLKAKCDRLNVAFANAIVGKATAIESTDLDKEQQ